MDVNNTLDSVLGQGDPWAFILVADTTKTRIMGSILAPWRYQEAGQEEVQAFTLVIEQLHFLGGLRMDGKVGSEN
jgi:hypothetical protein